MWQFENFLQRWLFLFLTVASVQATKFTGSLNTGESYTLIGRFAFNKAPDDSPLQNKVTISVTNPSLYKYFVVGLYFENWETWSQYTTDSTCVEKISFATRLVCTTEKENCPTLPLDEDGNSIVIQPDSWSQSMFVEDDINMTTGDSAFDFTANYEVEWFWIVLANCNVEACNGMFGRQI